MAIFEQRRKFAGRDNDSGGSGGLDFDELEDLKDSVPDVSDQLESLNRAITEPVTEPVVRGCGCWG